MIDVDEVDTDRLVNDPDLSGLRSAKIDLFEPEDLWPSGLREADCCCHDATVIPC